MLYYNRITKSEGIDETEDQDCIRITNRKSRQCYCCLYYFFSNRKYKQYVCNCCHHCVLREEASKSIIFRIITTRWGIFRTVSEYNHTDIVNLIEISFLNERTGLLYKCQNEYELNERVEILKRQLQVWTNSWIFM